MRVNTSICTIPLLVCLVSAACGADWITAPSYYTHDPQTGERVSQYTPIGPVYTFVRPDYRRSGFRHTRSSIQAGGSRDHFHIVEEWGRPIRPYGEWRFPYRPYSVPYDLWGPPFGGLERPFFFHPGLRRHVPLPGAAGRGAGPSHRDPSWSDGSYPPYRSGPLSPAPRRRPPGHRPTPGPAPQPQRSPDPSA